MMIERHGIIVPLQTLGNVNNTNIIVHLHDFNVEILTLKLCNPCLQHTEARKFNSLAHDSKI